MSLKRQEQSEELEPRKYSIEEYFELEYNSEFKHEFHNGKIVECAYKSENHGIIIHNLDILLGTSLRLTDCQVFTNKRMLYVSHSNSVYYPDLLIVCGEKEYYEYSKNIVATTNPSVLIEVVSDSTFGLATRLKSRCYRKLKSLNQYVLIWHDFKLVDVFEKDINNRWGVIIYEEDDDIIKIGDCEIPISEIYHKIDFPITECVLE